MYSCAYCFSSIASQQQQNYYGLDLDSIFVSTFNIVHQIKYVHVPLLNLRVLPELKPRHRIHDHANHRLFTLYFTLKCSNCYSLGAVFLTKCLFLLLYFCFSFATIIEPIIRLSITGERRPSNDQTQQSAMSVHRTQL